MICAITKLSLMLRHGETSPACNWKPTTLNCPWRSLNAVTNNHILSPFLGSLQNFLLRSSGLISNCVDHFCCSAASKILFISNRVHIYWSPLGRMPLEGHPDVQRSWQTRCQMVPQTNILSNFFSKSFSPFPQLVLNFFKTT